MLSFEKLELQLDTCGAPKVLTQGQSFDRRRSSLPSRRRGCRHVFLVRSLEVFDRALIEVPDPRRHLIDQIVIVGHQQHRALIALDGDVQRIDRLQIEVVRRFVEDEDVRLLQHQAGRRSAAPPLHRRAPRSSSIPLRR